MKVWKILTVTALFAVPGLSWAPTEELFGNYHFLLEIEGVSAGVFTRVRGLGYDTEVIESVDEEGNSVHKIPGAFKLEEIVMSRSFSYQDGEDIILRNWQRDFHDNNLRAKVHITLCQQGSKNTNRCKPAAKWQFEECFPSGWSLITEAMDQRRLLEEVRISCDLETT